MGDHMFNLKLVSEVEKQPCLYNFTLPQYSRKDVTKQAWDEVGKAVNLSGRKCKERWKNLRAAFVRHLRPGHPFRTTKPYYLADAMAFTLPFVKTAAGDGKRERYADSDDDAPLAACGDDRSPCSSPATPASPASRDATLPSPQPSNWKKRSLDDPKEDRAADRHSPKPSPIFIHRHRCKRPRPEQPTDTTHHGAEEDQTGAADTDHREDANRMFLMSLLPDVNLMTPAQVRCFKRAVLQSIDDILDHAQAHAKIELA